MIRSCSLRRTISVPSLLRAPSQCLLTPSCHCSLCQPDHLPPPPLLSSPSCLLTPSCTCSLCRPLSASFSVLVPPKLPFNIQPSVHVRPPTGACLLAPSCTCSLCKPVLPLPPPPPTCPCLVGSTRPVLKTCITTCTKNCLPHGTGCMCRQCIRLGL